MSKPVYECGRAGCPGTTEPHHSTRCPIRTWLVPLTGDQIRLLRSAIDSHLYEQANNNGWPVNSGFVLDPRLDFERTHTERKAQAPLTEEEAEIVGTLDEHDKLDALLRDFDVADTENE